MKSNDTVYIYLDFPNIPDQWECKAPGWYALPAVTGLNNQPVYPNKLLSHSAKVIVQGSTQKILKFAGVPSKVNVRVNNEAMNRIKQKAIAKDYSDCIKLTVSNFKERVLELGFDNLDQYSDFWTRFIPYTDADRRYLDLFYLFRQTGPMPMPGQPKGHANHDTIVENNKSCDTC